MTRKDEETLQKADIDTILSVNKKAIELYTENSEQNEEIIEYLSSIKGDTKTLVEKQKEMADEIKTIEKAQFKLLVLLGSGVVSLVLQLIQLLAKH